MAVDHDDLRRRARKESGLAAFVRENRRCVVGLNGRKTLAWKCPGTPEFQEHGRLQDVAEKLYRHFVRKYDPAATLGCPPWPVDADEPAPAWPVRP